MKTLQEIQFKLSLSNTKIIDVNILGKERSIRDNGMLEFKAEDKITELKREMEFKLYENKKIKPSLQSINEKNIIEKYTKLIQREENLIR